MTALRPVPIVRPLAGPPGFPVDDYIEYLSHPYAYETHQQAREWRYQICRMNPIMFALLYLPSHLELPDDDGGIVHALSDLHVDMASSARRWAARRIGPKAIRDIWVAPRHGAKSTWLFLILPLWALAYGHLEFIAIYSDTEEGQAKIHFKTLKAELANNERLGRDFPELCTPARRDGVKVMDNATGYLAASGAAVMVKGMNSATLGVKLGRRRPDGLFFDDIEPAKGKYGATMKDARLEDLIDAILPMNFEAVVQIAGTTVMHGSIIHDAIEGEAWVGAERFTVHHYKGVVRDPVTDEPRSLWPEKWPLPFLYAEMEANPRGYAKNFDNSPINADGTYWRPEHFVHGEFAVDERILVIDPTGKSGKHNDETGIAKLGYSRTLERMLVEDVIGVRLEPDQLCDRIRATCRLHGIRLGIVDITNGGDWIIKALEREVPFVEWHGKSITRGKPDRFAELLDRYLRRPRQVQHAYAISALESVMCAYPKVKHDDVIDAVELGATYFFEGLAKVGK